MTEPNRRASQRRLPAACLLLLLLPLAQGAGARELPSADDLQWLVPGEVMALMVEHDPHGPVVIDARPKPRYVLGHIPGAWNISSKDMWGWIEDLEPYRERGIVLYDDNGLNAHRAGHKLLIDGFRKVFLMRGYYPAWLRKGYPHETGEPPN